MLRLDLKETSVQSLGGRAVCTGQTLTRVSPKRHDDRARATPTDAVVCGSRFLMNQGQGPVISTSGSLVLHS